VRLKRRASSWPWAIEPAQPASREELDLMASSLILVVTHPRSGTHFVINSLCLNLKRAHFPLIRGASGSINGLMFDHDDEYTQEWERSLAEDDGTIRVIKSHMPQAEIAAALHSRSFLTSRDRRLLTRIYEEAKIVYVYRDGRDVLTSWYHYMLEVGAGLPQGGQHRLQQCSFSEFIRMPNKFFTPVRGFEERDENRVRYWSSHVNEWTQSGRAICLSYESLHRDFPGTLQQLIVALGMEGDRLTEVRRPQLPKGLAGFSARVMRRVLRLLAPPAEPGGPGPNYEPPPAMAPRKGIIGDWRGHFKDDDLAFFRQYGEETMVRLGYKL
jgi:hypothetical protein